VRGRVRRTRFAFFSIAEALIPDFPQLLRGRVELLPTRQLLADSLLTGERSIVTLEDLGRLLEFSQDSWQVPAEETLGLARRGLLVSDLDEEPFADLRRRDEQLERLHWDDRAALYHLAGSWRGAHVQLEATEPVPGVGEVELAEALSRYGDPPPHFHRRPDARETIALSPGEREGGLYDALRGRKTARNFDRGAAVDAEQLSQLLFWTFGAHGYATPFERLTILKKTSPSGGAMHPVEAYPLVLRVEGVEPGLYHYAVGEHTLELLQPLELEACEQLASELTAGQTYFASAALLVVLTARFERSFWKYRRHPRAYAVVLMDAAHLAQTFALVATELGLGAFVTAAINGGDIEDVLGLDGFEEGALAICGCGVATPAPEQLEPRFRAYEPDRSSPSP
jgi:putative peptide maturation dehydrogenase